MSRHSTRPRTAPERTVPDAESLPADQRIRRDRIVEAAVALLASVDYADIQVKAVAARADVALGTLYRYFSSKDHLMAEALLSWRSGFPVPDAGTSADGVADRIKTVYGRAATAFERSPHVYGALLHLQTTTDPLAAARYAEFASSQNETFARVLHDLPTDVRADIVDVMGAVLNQVVRSRTAGTLTQEAARRRIDRAADLLARACG